MVITADGGHRGGKIVELKAATDKALAGGCDTVEHVVVLNRCDMGVELKTNREIWWSRVIKDQPEECEPEWVDAEASLIPAIHLWIYGEA